MQVKAKVEDLHGAQGEPHHAEARVNDRSTKEGLKCEQTSPEGERRREGDPGCQRRVEGFTSRSLDMVNPGFSHLASRAKEPPAPGARGWGTAGPHAGERSGSGPVRDEFYHQVASLSRMDSQGHPDPAYGGRDQDYWPHGSTPSGGDDSSSDPLEGLP